MAQCPICQAPVTEDFGLIECKKCGAALFVEFDGTVKAQSDDVPTQMTISQSVTVDITDELFGSDPQPEQNFGYDATEIQTFEESTPPPPPADRTEILAEQFENMPQSVVLTPPETSSEEHMDDLKDFANSPMSQGREGLLRVNVVISGIDTADLRNMVYEALLDRKFL